MFYPKYDKYHKIHSFSLALVLFLFLKFNVSLLLVLLNVRLDLRPNPVITSTCQNVHGFQPTITSTGLYHNVHGSVGVKWVVMV